MVFLDINTFFYGSDGGIRTFYNAKINWFKNHPEHQYYLVHPDSRGKIDKLADNIYLVHCFGVKGIIGKNRLLIFDYLRVLRLIHRVKPDVLEAGDPLLTPFFTVFAKKIKIMKGLLSCYHHSNPIKAYVLPWAYGVRTNLVKRIIARTAIFLYKFTHRRHPISMVASQWMKNSLLELGIENVVVKPLGVQKGFLHHSMTRVRHDRKLLYASRLEPEKGTALLKKALPRLLQKEGLKITIMGQGSHQSFFENYSHPGLEYVAYKGNLDEVVSVYKDHSIYLAPGPYETFGLGVLEALANGMIVVGPDAGGTGELLSAMDSPFIFSQGNSDSFIEAVERALGSDISQESQRSMEFARGFDTWEVAINNMMDFYIENSRVLTGNQNDKKSDHIPA